MEPDVQKLTNYHSLFAFPRDMPAPNSNVLDPASGTPLGRARTFVAGRGLALVRLSGLRSAALAVHCSESGRDFAAQTWVPSWWPENFGVKLPKQESS